MRPGAPSAMGAARARKLPYLWMAGLCVLPSMVGAVVVKSDKTAKPNFVFLHDESTDGRLYLEGSPVPIPNIRKLQKKGVNFENHYVNVPICCPSRASLWSGRQPHNIPHIHNDIEVNGAWNNYEGVGIGNSSNGKPGLGNVDENDLIGVQLEEHGYSVTITGKTDWASGGHSLTTMVDSWSIYSRFPYSQPEEGGWHIWGDCGGNLTVEDAKSAHQRDWNVVNKNSEYIAGDAFEQQPFFLYQGLNIVHPPYATTQEYLDRIDVDKIEAPFWPALDTLHPCDLQTSMKKGCALPFKYQNTTAWKKDIISGYYAMIAEYDDMVGVYVDAIEKAGLTQSTIFILSSDHGDMQMQHQQFYKMVAYEASTHVPLVISPGSNFKKLRYRGGISALTSHVDMFPTFMDLAGIPIPDGLDGHSLVPFLQKGKSLTHPTSIISQFHGENLVMSWYMVREGDIKATFWGTGKEHVAQMFNLSSDPHENNNLAADKRYDGLLSHMEQILKSQVDYPAVSVDVASYNIKMAKWWIGNESSYHCILNGTCTDPNAGLSKGELNEDWGDLWRLGSQSYWDAWNKWINSPPEVVPCSSNLTYNWPPMQ